MQDWSRYVLEAAALVHLRGRVPEVIAVVVMLLTLAILLWLVAWVSRSKKSALTSICAIVAVAVAASVLSWYVTNKVWRPMPDYVGIEVFGPLASGLASIFALLVIAISKKPRRIAVASLTCVIAVLTAYAVPNIYYGTYANLAKVLQGTGDVQDLSEVEGIAPVADIFHPNPAPTAQRVPLEQQWQPRHSSILGSDDRSAASSIAQAEIPATNFSPRPSIIYIPPAYFARPRPLLPVLVLMAGQPGAPEGWLVNGNLKHTMDHFAAQHDGLAPIVAVVDQLSSNFKNPLCSDTNQGAVATYLEHDVPTWLEQHFQVDTRPQSWAVGGLSNGGTCAMQVISRRDGPYRTVLDMSGEEHPNLNSLEMTIEKGFGGDKGAFEANNPLSIFASGADFTGYSAFCSIGDKEPDDVIEGLWKVCQAARDQGMDVEERTYPGTHEWKVWEHALDDELSWLTEKMQLI
ncbi:MAG: alpha/beta hydrolase-fold protein [Corynebacterium sp.]|uniref:alpha/beta hydrolase n=1 Tax=Corynebacterium sp. TaxID=1720 RepID=UPI0026DB1E93|nr:alpha/beta hydrolase-fold protein [Corynebacterium sp.]MDO5029540.1 alpha/beta hydrolase-fold protein [Corynebacterium sp.]